MPTHYIPTKVTVVSRPETSITQAHTQRSIKIRPSFVVPSASTKMLLTARRWAASWVPAGTVINEVTCDNTSMKNLQVVGVEHRSEGGVAFKVITDKGYYVDLREDEFMEALLMGRIDKDGFIKGDYVWSVGGNQMRIVRVGSDIYKERLKTGLLETLNTTSGQSGSPAKKMAVIPPKQLVKGSQYQTAVWGTLEYAGRIRRTDDRRLIHAWYNIRPPTNPFGRGDGTKDLIVTTGSIALQDLGPSEARASGAVVSNVYNGYGESLSRISLEWPDGSNPRFL